MRLRALPPAYWVLLPLTLGQLGMFAAAGGTMHLPGGLMLTSSAWFTVAVLLTVLWLARPSGKAWVLLSTLNAAALIAGVSDSLVAGSWAWPADYVLLVLSAIAAEVLLLSRPMLSFIDPSPPTGRTVQGR